MSKIVKKTEVQMLEEEARNGNFSALYNLGYIYLLGEGVEVDLNKAVIYFRRGATHQDGKCMQALAMCFRNGDGVAVNLEKMIYWLNNGVKIQDSGCMYQLALCYENGQGVKKDENQAIVLMKQAAIHDKEARKWLKAHGLKAPNFFQRLKGGKA